MVFCELLSPEYKTLFPASFPLPEVECNLFLLASISIPLNRFVRNDRVKIEYDFFTVLCLEYICCIVCIFCQGASCKCRLKWCPFKAIEQN